MIPITDSRNMHNLSFFFFLLPLVINDQCQSGWPWQCGSFCVYLDLAKTLMLVFSEMLCL